MTLTNIKTTLLTDRTPGIETSIFSLISKLEKVYQGTTVLEEICKSGVADGITDQRQAINTRHLSTAEDPWSERVKRAGLVPVEGEPQEFDVLEFDNSYFTAMFVDGKWYTKCSNGDCAAILGKTHGYASYEKLLRHNLVKIYRFKNA